MGVKSQHKDYDKMLARWQRCIDAAAGTEAIHAANTLYLPQLMDQQQADYDKMRDRTVFYNATWRTISGLQGMLFRKPPQVVVPPIVSPMLTNVTLTGVPFHIFALNVCEEVLKSGRAGVFADYPIVDTKNATAADALLNNYRPFLKMYDALAIINWKTRTIKNATVLSMVVLRENRTTVKDEFSDTHGLQYRVLDLVDVVDEKTGDINVYYRVRIFIVNEKDEDVCLSTNFPVVNGAMLTEIPFQFISDDSVSADVDAPPLMDLVDMNIAHYRVSADYEHGCHFTGLPTAVISGYTPTMEAEKFYVGSTAAWIFPNPSAKASYLEFTGQGLGALERNLAAKEAKMAVLGARMLESRSSGVESADTAAIHRTGEQSMLASVAQSVSIGLTRILRLFADMAGAKETAGVKVLSAAGNSVITAGNVTNSVKFELNRDFFPIGMDALTLTAIIAGWQNGAYSYDTMFFNLQQGEIIPADNNPKDEQAAIEANPPPMVGVPTTPGDRAGNGPAPSANSGGPAPGASSKHGATSNHKTITQLQNS